MKNRVEWLSGFCVSHYKSSETVLWTFLAQAFFIQASFLWAMARRTPLQEAILAAEAEVRSLRQVVERARQSDKQCRNRLRIGSEESETLLLALVSVLSASPSIVYLCYRCVSSLSAEAAPAEERHVLPDDVAARIACPAVITKAAALLAARPHSFLVDRAARMTAEAHVAIWLAEVNAKGVAASSMQMAVVLRRHWPAAGRSAKTQRLLLRMRHSSAAVRIWSRRFRLRWGISWRRLSTRADMNPDSIRFRVPLLIKFGDQNRDQKGAPNLGTIFGPRNGDLLLIRVSIFNNGGGPKRFFFGSQN